MNRKDEVYIKIREKCFTLRDTLKEFPALKEQIDIIIGMLFEMEKIK